METEIHCRLYSTVALHARITCGSAQAGGVLLVLGVPESDD